MQGGIVLTRLCYTQQSLKVDKIFYTWLGGRELRLHAKLKPNAFGCCAPEDLSFRPV